MGTKNNRLSSLRPVLRLGHVRKGTNDIGIGTGARVQGAALHQPVGVHREISAVGLDHRVLAAPDRGPIRPVTGGPIDSLLVLCLVPVPPHRGDIVSAIPQNVVRPRLVLTLPAHDRPLHCVVVETRDLSLLPPSGGRLHPVPSVGPVLLVVNRVHAPGRYRCHAPRPHAGDHFLHRVCRSPLPRGEARVTVPRVL